VVLEPFIDGSATKSLITPQVSSQSESEHLYYLYRVFREYMRFVIICAERDEHHKFWMYAMLLLMFRRMFALATLMALIHQVSGTPYITGGDSPAGTDCSGLASWVSNVAQGKPAFGDRFNTGDEASALLKRGFHFGTAPGALVIGWNGHHTAVTLPDGTPVSSGEGGGVRIGGGGAYQRQFTHHMFLPVAPDEMDTDPDSGNAPVIVDAVNAGVPAPAPDSQPL
jgi:hypothetical protein